MVRKAPASLHSSLRRAIASHVVAEICRSSSMQDRGDVAIGFSRLSEPSRYRALLILPVSSQRWILSGTDSLIPCPGCIVGHTGHRPGPEIEGRTGEGLCAGEERGRRSPRRGRPSARRIAASRDNRADEIFSDGHESNFAPNAATTC